MNTRIKRYSIGLWGIVLLLGMGMTLYAQEGRRVETIRLTAVGDIMMHQGQIDGGKVSDGYAYDYMFDKVRSHLQQSDLVVGNLETTLAGAHRGYTGYPAFNAPEQLATALKTAGFDVLTTANNHSLDRRYDGVVHTLDTLDQVGMMWTGTARSKAESEQVLVVDVEGIKIAFLAYTYGTNGIRADKGKEYCVNLISQAKIKKDIEKAKASGVDLICVSMHFGEEYMRLPNAKQQEWVDMLFDQGVNIILGSHPHVLQKMEQRSENQFVIYSLGNFVSGQRNRYRDSSILLDLTISKDFATGKTTIDAVDYTPIWTDLTKVAGKGRYRVLPVVQAMAQYESKSDPYLSQGDYNKLKESLQDTREMYGRTVYSEMTVVIGGRAQTYQSIQINGQTLVEAKAVAQQLGIQVVWNAEEGRMQMGEQGREWHISPGSRYVKQGERVVEWHTPSRLVDGKIYVPLRSLCEVLGKGVTFDSATKSIVISK